MKTLPAALAAHVATGATTLAWGWKLVRRDGVTMGFSDFDRDLTCDGVTFKAASGFTASELAASLGLAVDNQDVDGALSSDAIAEGDIAAGLYDDAALTLYRINWADPTQFVVVRTGNIGEVTRGEIAFRAEFRSLAHRLNQTIGRTIQYQCDAVVGDARCGVALSTASFTGTATVVSLAERTLLVSGLGAYLDGWFDGGRLTWLTGANAGLKVDVVRSEAATGGVALTLWSEPARTVAAGDTASVSAGCDKTFPTCKSKFSNAVNYRGFPHVPGTDWLMRYGKAGDDGLDGSALYP